MTGKLAKANQAVAEIRDDPAALTLHISNGMESVLIWYDMSVGYVVNQRKPDSEIEGDRVAVSQKSNVPKENIEEFISKNPNSEMKLFYHGKVQRIE